MKNNRYEKIFTVTALILTLTLACSVLLFDYNDRWEVTGWGLTVAKLMLYYLVLVIMRAALLLAFSSMDYIFERSLKDLSHYPLVTILVPCFNEENVISNAIQSLEHLHYPNFEIIVIDDGSFDLTAEIAKKFENKNRLRVVYQENAGKAQALNRGISEAVGDYFLCMDADSVLDPDVLNHAMPYFEADRNLASVAGSVRVGNGRSSLLCMFQKLEYIVGLNFQKRAQSFLNLVTIVPGPIGVFRKSFVESIGGYDSSTFAEDCDLSMRLLIAGYNTKYCSKMVAITEAPVDFYSLMIQRYRWSRGNIQAITKNAEWLRLKNFDFRNFTIVAYMLAETVIIPAINFTFAILTISYALSFDNTQIYGPYFIGLTLLDMTLSLYSIVFENQVGPLFILSVVNRFTYGFMLEIMRFFAIFDELFRIPMKWGTIQRRGLGELS